MRARFLPALVALCGALLTRAEPPPLTDPDAMVPACPGVVTGRLENGLRYALLRHSAHPGQISLRLLVAAGSLQENDEERGYAHFVEHMAFNGTRHFPAGELVQFLQRQGVKFGPHLNAETTADHTLYRLDLSAAAPPQLQTGLRILRDFADGLLFEPAEVERERGVIVSEDLLRQTPQAARQTARTALLLAGTRYPDRPPSGTEASINAATPEGLRSFYDTWYRPERLSIVLVGDLDPEHATALLRDHFGSLAARRPARPALSAGPLQRRADTAIALHAMNAQPTLRFQFGLIWPSTEGPTRWSDVARDTYTQTATRLFARRLDQLEKTASPAFSSTQVVASTPVAGFRALSVGFSPSNERWEHSLATLEQELRRAAEHGFSAAELAVQVRIEQDNLQHAVEALATAPPALLADEIVDAWARGAQFSTFAETHATITRLLERATPEDCRRSFRELLAHGPPVLFVTGPSARLPTPTRIAAVLAQSRTVPVAAQTDAPELQFSYTDFGPAGRIVRRDHIVDLDLWLVEFANGVRLNLKRTAFEPGQVRCRIRLGHGRLVEPPEHPGLSLWTAAWFAGGLGRHDWATITRLGDTHNLAVTCTRETDAFLLGGRARPAQLELLLQILTAYLSDPAFRPEGFTATTAFVNSAVRPLWSTADGWVQRRILPRLAGGDPRLGTPFDDTLFANKPEHLRAWLAPIVATSQPEISLVGDFDIETAIATVARTFGALPPRAPAGLDPALRVLKFPTPPFTETIAAACEAPRPARLELFWRAGDPTSPRQHWQLAQLAAVLADRMRVRVRETEGASYTARASFSRTAAYTGFAYLRCSLDVRPDQATQYLDTVRTLAAALAHQGVTPEELARAKAPALAHARAARTDNAYWLDEVLAEAQSDPERLPAARTFEADIASATKADLDALARRYLQPDSAFCFIILPQVEPPAMGAGHAAPK
ncbi:MAG: insulinase family protein [Opitutaceae bacterium]|nr:insulinase family protein [Opitutaceae bacterium]